MAIPHDLTPRVASFDLSYQGTPVLASVTARVHVRQGDRGHVAWLGAGAIPRTMARPVAMGGASAGMTLRWTVAVEDAARLRLELSIENTGTAPLVVDGLDPLVVQLDGPRGLLLGDDASVRALQHGWQSWSACASRTLEPRAPQAPDVANFAPKHLPHGPDTGKLQSEWATVLQSHVDGRAIVGFLDGARMLAEIRVEPLPAPETSPSTSLDAQSDGPSRERSVSATRFLVARAHADGLSLAPGNSCSRARCGSSWVATRTCCWLPTRAAWRTRWPCRSRDGPWLAGAPGTTSTAKNTEDDVLANLDQLATLPGLRHVILDDGYQAEIGDWLHPSERFPHGIEWLASRMRRRGLVPGIWTAPFCAIAAASLNASTPTGSCAMPSARPCWPCKTGATTSMRSTARVATYRTWLRETFARLCAWGYDVFKVDFVYAAALPGVRFRAGATRAEATATACAPSAKPSAPNGCCSAAARHCCHRRPGGRHAHRHRCRTLLGPHRRQRRCRRLNFALRNTMTRAFWQGTWQNDPDCVLMRSDRRERRPRTTRGANDAHARRVVRRLAAR